MSFWIIKTFSSVVGYLPKTFLSDILTIKRWHINAGRIIRVCIYMIIYGGGILSVQHKNRAVWDMKLVVNEALWSTNRPSNLTFDIWFVGNELTLGKEKSIYFSCKIWAYFFIFIRSSSLYRGKYSLKRAKTIQPS